MSRRRLKFALLPALALLFSLMPTPLRPQEGLHDVWAVKGCRVLVKPGLTIDKANVVIRGGLIEAVGPETDIPPEAEVIDGTGLTVHAGLIDALNQSLLKLPEIKFDPSRIMTGQYSDEDKGITPGLRAFDCFEVGKAQIDKHHKWGITAVQVLPQRGILTGKAAVFSLSGTDKNRGLLLADNALGVGFAPAGFLVYPMSLMGVVAFLRQEFSDASYFETHRSRWEKEMNGIARPVHDPTLQTLEDYAAGRKPVIFICRNQHDIRRALSLTRELNLNSFIGDLGNEAFRVIPELKEAGAGVICGLDFKAPSTSIHAQRGKEAKQKAEQEIYVKNPALIAEAGIPFAFGSSGTDDPQSFLDGVRKAVANGLSRDKALEALTVTAARIIGLDRALGTVEAGKIANLVLIQGDPLTEEAKVVTVFADGQKFDMKEPAPTDAAKPTVNVSGKWELDIQGAGIKVTVDLIQEEAEVLGRMTTPFGVFDLSSGTISANQVYFEAILSLGGQEIELFFTAAVEGDKMTGTVVQGTEGSTEFTGRRIPG